MKKSCLEVAIRRQKGLCFYCYRPMGRHATVEHLLAKSRGGRKTYGNVRAAHGNCNAAVGNLEVKHKLRLAKVGKRFGYAEMQKVAAHIHAEEARLAAKHRQSKLAHTRASGVCGLTEGLLLTLSRRVSVLE